MNKTYGEGVVLRVDRLHSILYRIIDVLKDKAFGFPMDEAVLLYGLFDKDGISQRELADKLSKDKSSIKRTIDKLEKKGVIERVKDEKDRRKYKIFITAEGYKHEDIFLSQLANGKEWLDSGLGKEIHRDVIKSLEILEVFFRDTLKNVKKSHSD